MKMPFVLSKIGAELIMEMWFRSLTPSPREPLETAHSSLSPTTFHCPKHWLSIILLAPIDMGIVSQQLSLKKFSGVTLSRWLRPSRQFMLQIWLSDAWTPAKLSWQIKIVYASVHVRYSMLSNSKLRGLWQNYNRKTFFTLEGSSYLSALTTWCQLPLWRTRLIN